VLSPATRTNQRRRRRAAVAAGLVLIAGGGTVTVLVARAVGGTSPQPVLRAYLKAWSHGDDAAAAALTTRPAAALEALRASRRGMDDGRVQAKLTDVETSEGRARARVTVRWRTSTVPPFEYRVELAAVERDSEWRVVWREAGIHPQLDDSTRLGTAVVASRRGDIVDRNGRPLVTARRVMDIAVRVDCVRDPRATATSLSRVVDVDAARLARAIRAVKRSGVGRYVPVVMLRWEDWIRRSDNLEALPMLSFAAGTAPLAPTRSFARATLGIVGPATAEQVERSNGRIAAGDNVGQFGLQARFERRLAGTPTRAVVVRDRESGVQHGALRRWPGRPGLKLRVLLEHDVQMAAERALAPVRGHASLVAVEPSSGDVLAVANRPIEDTYDRALLGRYPPGSTFKVVTTAALLRAGLSPDEVVPCPPTAEVDGRRFRNFEGGSGGAVPFRDSFAYSCNTAFVSLTQRLGEGSLPDAARDFGLGQRLRMGVPVAEASVPEPTGLVNEAATMIGQDRVLASPLAMAGVAATVADGRWRSPRLLPDDRARAGAPLPQAELAVLRTLMRAVVTQGTGTALAGVPGEVRGKSGTAEYGAGNPPPTHAWFIATRDDLALTVLVEGGRAGGEVAAPVVQQFFAALDA
jgi:cell division protein FtsI/penicillin-binding protein 2